MRTKKKNRNIVKKYFVKKIKVICICKRGNCEGFCNGIGNVDIKKKLSSGKPRKKRCNCGHG